jgi:hypothetical protein
MGAQGGRQHTDEDRGTAGALARAGPLHAGQCLGFRLGSVGVLYIPVSRSAE